MPTPPADWFTNEDFWEASYDVMFPAERFDAAPREWASILDLVGETPRRVLDLACGPGRHAMAAARQGLHVVGVDRSAFLLQKAQDRAVREGLEIQWVHADMREAVQTPAVDLVLNLFTSFGYFDDDSENQRVLQNAHDSLHPGGTLVVDVAGKEVLARIFSPHSVEDAPGGMIVHRRRVADDWRRMENEWVRLRDGVARSFHFGHWIYSGRELAEMLAWAGFAEVRLVGDFGGAPYGPEATRLVAIARKP